MVREDYQSDLASPMIIGTWKVMTTTKEKRYREELEAFLLFYCSVKYLNFINNVPERNPYIDDISNI